MFTMLVARVSVVVASRSSSAWARSPAGDEPSHSAPKPSRQRQHHLVTGLPFLLGDEIVDRFQVEFLIQGQQVHVQHQQAVLHGHHLPAI
jgi:hypothetical protein